MHQVKMLEGLTLPNGKVQLTGNRLQITRREALLWLGAGGLALSLGPEILSACATQGAPTKTVGDNLTWALFGPVLNLDPARNADYEGNVAITLGYEGLLAYDFQGKLQPLLAQSWSQLDPLTYVYKLREGVKFWDGTTLTPDDVVFSFNRVLDPKTKSQWAPFLTSVDIVKVTGANEVTVKLRSPDPLFSAAPAFACRIVSRKFVAANAGDFGMSSSKTMGTGPYTFTEFTPSESVTAVRNKHYWGHSAKFAQITLQTISDQSALQLAVRSRSVDGTFRLSLDQLPAWKDMQAVRVHLAQDLEITACSSDITQTPWNDLHVRRAVAYAFDRKGIVEAVYGGYGEVAPSIVPYAQWVDVQSNDEVKHFYASLTQYSFDLQKAKNELAQSSVPNGFSLTTFTTDSLPNRLHIAESLSQNLKQIGISLTIKQVPYAQWLKDYVNTHDFRILEWLYTTADVSEFTKLLDPTQTYDWANYQNQQMATLLKQVKDSRNQSTRAAAIKQVLSINADEAIYIPICFRMIAMAINSKYVYRGFNPWVRWQNWPEGIEAA